MPSRSPAPLFALLSRAMAEPEQLRRAIGAVIRGDGRLQLKSPTVEELSLGEIAMRAVLRENLVTRDEILRPLSWKSELIDVLAARSSNALGHEEATAALNRLSKRLDVGNQTSAAYFAIARAASAIGLYEGSYGFTLLAYRRVERDARRSRDLRNQLRAILVAIHLQRPDVATERWVRVSQKTPVAGPTRDLFTAIARYMNVWQPPGHARSTTPDRRWRDALLNKRVIVVGPAPSDHDAAIEHNFDFVVRMLRGPSLNVPQQQPAHKHEIMYSATGWYSTIEGFSPKELRSRFADYAFFVAKGRAPKLHTTLENMRVTDNDYRLLFLSGHPNLIPIACLDLLETGGTSVHVVGTNFYASNEPYAPGSVDGLIRYELTRSVANHNPVQNRAFVANLVNAGKVTGDKQLLESIALSDLEYLRRLDAHFGRSQR